MKRYFIVATEHLPHGEKLGGRHLGEYHFVDLESHGGAPGVHALVLLDDAIEPPAEWEALPHLLEQTPIEPHHAAHLKGLKVDPDHTAYKAAAALGRIHPKFRP